MRSTTSSTLRGFEATSGAPQWSASLAGRGNVVAAGDRQPIWGTRWSHSTPLDGLEVWRTEVPKRVGHLAQHGVVYVACDRRVCAAAADTGQKAWDPVFDGTLAVLFNERTLYLLRNREIAPSTRSQGRRGAPWSSMATSSSPMPHADPSSRPHSAVPHRVCSDTANARADAAHYLGV